MFSFFCLTEFHLYIIVGDLRLGKIRIDDDDVDDDGGGGSAGW